jgi:hypothetical protein
MTQTYSPDRLTLGFRFRFCFSSPIELVPASTFYIFFPVVASPFFRSIASSSSCSSLSMTAPLCGLLPCSVAWLVVFIVSLPLVTDPVEM